MSGNFVALFLLGIEYQNTRIKVIDSFIVESNHMRTKIANGLNFNFLFGDIFESDGDSIVLNKSSIENFLKQESNIKELDHLMVTFISLSEITTINLGFLFNDYHSLLSINTEKDKTRKLLHKVYFDFFNLINEIKLTSWHFKEQFHNEKINYSAMIHVLFNFMKGKYVVKQKENRILFYEDYLYRIDKHLDSVIILLNPDYAKYDYDMYLILEIIK